MATYYCDYKNGNDSTGDGSSGAPWKTIGYAVGQLAVEDTLNLRGSDLEDEAYNAAASNNKNPPDNVTIQNDTGHSPVIVRSLKKTAGDFSKTAGQTNVYECAFVGSLYGNAPVWHEYSDPTRLTEVADIATCDSTTNSYYHDDGNNKLYVNVGGDAPGSVFLANAVAATFRHTSEGVTYDGLTWKFGCQCIWARDVAPTPDNTTIQNCSHYYSSGWMASFYITAGAATISNIDAAYGYMKSVIRLESSAGVVDVSSVTITDWEGEAIYSQAGTMNVSDVTLTRCGAPSEPALFWNTGTSDGSLKNFTIIDPIDNAVSSCIGIVIQRGVIYWTGDETYQSGDLGIVTHHSSGTIELYHITIYNGKAPAADGALGAAYYLGTDATVKMRNCGAVKCEYGVYVPDASNPVIDIDYLGFYSNTNNYYNVDPGDQASNEITGDPAFEDEASYDFHLTGSSAWRDTGVVVPGINDGYSGTAPDIGRYEYEIAEDVWMLIETVGLSEAVEHHGWSVRAIAETLGLSEAASRRAWSLRTLTESLSPTDDATRRGRFVRQEAESVSVAEVLNRSAAWVRVFAETVGVTEAFNRSAGWVRQLAETVGLSETAARRARSTRSLAETEGISETTVRRAWALRLLSETVGIVETFVRWVPGELVRMMAEALDISDAPVKRAWSVRGIAETIGLADAWQRVAGWVRVAAETVGIVEGFVRSTYAQFSKLMTEVVGIGETALRRAWLTKQVSEVVGLAIGGLRRLWSVRAASETVDPGDISSRRLWSLRLSDEAVNVLGAGRVTYGITKIITEAVGLLDSLVQTFWHFFRKSVELDSPICEAVELESAICLSVELDSPICEAVELESAI